MEKSLSNQNLLLNFKGIDTTSSQLLTEKITLSIQQSKTSLDVMERLLEVSEYFRSFWPFNKTSLAIP